MNFLIQVLPKFYLEMVIYVEIGIYILVHALCLGDRVCCFLLLEKRAVTTPLTILLDTSTESSSPKKGVNLSMFRPSTKFML